MANLITLEGDDEIGWGKGSFNVRPHLSDVKIRVSSMRNSRPHILQPTYTERHLGRRIVPTGKI